MKKLVATAPRVAALVEYEDRPVAAHEVKIRARYGAPKHGTEVVDFRAASPFIDEEFNAEWQMFTPREEGAARGIEFGKFQLGNMIVGDIIECGADVTEYQIGDSVCCYGPLQETVIVNAVNNYKLRKMPQGASWKNAVCYDPAQFAMSGVRDANVRVGDFVVVVGLGAIGQIAIQLAKKAGASVVIGVDPIEHRCEIARRHGADHCLNPIGTDVGLEIKKCDHRNQRLCRCAAICAARTCLRRHDLLRGFRQTFCGRLQPGPRSTLQQREDCLLPRMQ